MNSFLFLLNCLMNYVKSAKLSELNTQTAQMFCTDFFRFFLSLARSLFVTFFFFLFTTHNISLYRNAFCYLLCVVVAAAAFYPLFYSVFFFYF